MPEDQTTTNDDVGQLISKLNIIGKQGIQQGVPSLADKNIISNASSGLPGQRKQRLMPSLDSNEKKRAYNFGTELFKAFFAIMEKKKVDTKPTTLIAQAKQKVEAKGLKESKEKKEGGQLSLVSTVIGLLVGLGLLLYKFGGEFGLSIMKIIPILFNLFKGGRILSFLSSLKNLLKIGKIFGAIKNIFSSIGGGIFKVIKNIFTGVKGGADDIAKKAAQKFSLKGLFKKIFGGLFKKGAGKAGGGLLGRIIPGAGLLLSLGFTFHYFKQGKWLRGLVELVGVIGHLATLTGIGAAIGVPLQILSFGVGLLMDMFGGDEKKEAVTQGEPQKGGFWDSIKKVGSWIWDKLKKIFLIDGIITMGSAIGKIFSGDFSNGITEFARGLWIFAGGDMIAKSIGWIVNLFSPQKEGEAKTSFTGQVWDVFKAIGNAITEKLRAFWDWIKDMVSGTIDRAKEWLELPDIERSKQSLAMQEAVNTSTLFSNIRAKALGISGTESQINKQYFDYIKKAKEMGREDIDKETRNIQQKIRTLLENKYTASEEQQAEYDVKIKEQTSLLEAKNKELKQLIEGRNNETLKQTEELTDVNRDQKDILVQMLNVQQQQLKEARKEKVATTQVALNMQSAASKTASPTPVTKSGSISMYSRSPYALGTA